MSSLLSKIEQNIKTSFEILSDYVFLIDDIYYLPNPSIKPPLKNYKFKYLRSDQDGVYEAEGTPWLSYLHFKNMLGDENAKSLIESVSKKSVEDKEREICEFLKENHINFQKFFSAGKKAVEEFKPVKNLFNFVHSVQTKLSYYLDIRSGTFGEIRIGKSYFDGPLKIFWKNLGVSSEQIGGSKAYFDEEGTLEKIELELEHKKSQPMPNYLQYVLGFTDTPQTDFPMIDVNLNILPLVFSFGKLAEIPRGIVIPCQNAKKDMMEAIRIMLKVERGIVEYFGNVDVEGAKKIGKEVKRLYEICFSSHQNFLKYKESFVNKSLDFLEKLSVEIGKRKYPLFPEELTGIKKYLITLQNSTNFEISKELSDKIIYLMKKYSAEFPR
ncbi:MAG: hypothetical protein QXG39_02350 [Candidatus Aenigmatarchaeota archaeon]